MVVTISRSLLRILAKQQDLFSLNIVCTNVMVLVDVLGLYNVNKSCGYCITVAEVTSVAVTRLGNS